MNFEKSLRAPFFRTPPGECFCNTNSSKFCHVTNKYGTGTAPEIFSYVQRHIQKSRSSRPEVFCKKGVLENFT